MLFFLAQLFFVACSDDDTTSSWELDEPSPEIEINSSYCSPMPGDALDEPRVTQQSSGSWRVRYPSFREGCGVYQLDAVFDFEPHEQDLPADSPHAGPSYSYEVTACNRCESSQTWNYLYDFSSGYPAPTALDVPVHPRTHDVSSDQPTALLRAGQPIVEHHTASADRVLPESVCSETGASNVGDPTYISYDDVRQMRLAPDQHTEQKARFSLEEFSVELLDHVVSEQEGETRILWPRLYSAEHSVTGLEAASATEYCVEQVLRRAGSWVRPYNVPYRIEEKYHKQSPGPLELPPELVERLSVSGSY